MAQSTAIKQTYWMKFQFISSVQPRFRKLLFIYRFILKNPILLKIKQRTKNILFCQCHQTYLWAFGSGGCEWGVPGLTWWVGRGLGSWPCLGLLRGSRSLSCEQLWIEDELLVMSRLQVIIGKMATSTYKICNLRQ